MRDIIPLCAEFGLRAIVWFEDEILEDFKNKQNPIQLRVTKV